MRKSWTKEKAKSVICYAKCRSKNMLYRGQELKEKGKK